MKKTLLLVISALFIVSCSANKSARVGSISEAEQELSTQEELSSRLSFQNQAIVLEGNPSSIYSSNVPEFTLIGTIKSPKVSSSDSRYLRATSSAKEGNRLYVSYLMEGAEVIGAMDIIDISVLHAPVLLSSIRYSTMEFSDVKVRNNIAYLVGYKKNQGAVFVAMNVSNPSAPVLTKYYSIPGNNATSLDIRSGQAVVGTAKNGGLAWFDLSVPAEPQIIKYEPKDNVLAVKAMLKNDNASNGELSALVIGGNGLTSLTLEGNDVQLSATESEAPSRLVTMGPLVYTATAAGISVSELSQRLFQPFVRSIPMPSKVNGLGMLDQKLYVAAGTQGLRIVDVKEPGAPVHGGYLKFEDNGSANNVWVERLDSNNKLIVMADGQSGVRLISEERLFTLESNKIKIHAKSKAYNGIGAKLQVKVNGVDFGSTIDVSTTDYVTYEVSGAQAVNFGDVVTVEFWNDESSRNVSIAYVQVGDDFFYQWHNNYFFYSNSLVHSDGDADNILMEDGGYLKFIF